MRLHGCFIFFDNSSRVLNLYRVDSMLGTGSLSIPILDHEISKSLETAKFDGFIIIKWGLVSTANETPCVKFRYFRETQYYSRAARLYKT